MTSSKGDHREVTGVLLELTNPRARLSRTETRGKLFSALGELCWYLAGSNDVDFISYYIPFYKTLSEGGFVHGGIWSTTSLVEGTESARQRDKALTRPTYLATGGDPDL